MFDGLSIKKIRISLFQSPSPTRGGKKLGSHIDQPRPLKGVLQPRYQWSGSGGDRYAWPKSAHNRDWKNMLGFRKPQRDTTAIRHLGLDHLVASATGLRDTGLRWREWG